MFRTLLTCLLLAAPAMAQDHAVGDILADPMALAAGAVARFDPTQEGRPALDIEVERTPMGALSVMMSVIGIPDDSLRGRREIYLLERRNDGRWIVTEAALEYLCWRGIHRSWQTDLCP